MEDWRIPSQGSGGYRVTSFINFQSKSEFHHTLSELTYDSFLCKQHYTLECSKDKKFQNDDIFLMICSYEESRRIEQIIRSCILAFHVAVENMKNGECEYVQRHSM